MTKKKSQPIITFEDILKETQETQPGQSGHERSQQGARNELIRSNTEIPVRRKSLPASVPQGQGNNAGGPVRAEAKPFKPWEDKVIAAYIENGGNQTAAFKVGKPQSKKWKDATVNVKASEFFALGKVRGRLASLQGEMLEKVLVTLEDITKGHLEVYRRCMQHEPVRHKSGEIVMIANPSYDPEGDEDDPMNQPLAAAYTFQAGVAAKVLDQLGKHTGWYEADNLQKPLEGRSVLLEFVDA